MQLAAAGCMNDAHALRYMSLLVLGTRWKAPGNYQELDIIPGNWCWGLAPVPGTVPALAKD